MKKLLSVAACTAVIGMAGSASAISYSDPVTLETWLGEGDAVQWIVDILNLDTPAPSMSYQHTMPVDFEVPYDIVNSAHLDITGYWVDDDGEGNLNDPVLVEGSVVGDLADGGTWDWNVEWFLIFPVGIDPDNFQPSLTSIDISPVFSSWETGDPLNIEIQAFGSLGDGLLYLDKSTFTLDYTNAVPEPTTMLLFGTGIAGLAAVGRRRK